MTMTTLSFSSDAFSDEVYSHFLTVVASGLDIYRFEIDGQAYYMCVSDLAEVFAFIHNSKLSPKIHNYTVRLTFDDAHLFTDHYQVVFG